MSDEKAEVPIYGPEENYIPHMKAAGRKDDGTYEAIHVDRFGNMYLSSNSSAFHTIEEMKTRLAKIEEVLNEILRLERIK